MQLAFLFACGLLLTGFVLRYNLRVLARLYIPASVVGGLIGLAIAQNSTYTGYGHAILAPILTSYRATWTTWLVAVVFAGMLLERPGGSARRNLRETAQQGIAAWIIILGQLVLGLTVAWLILGPAFGVPVHLGQVLEVTWAGGFGSAAGWGAVHEGIGVFPEAKDVALFGATCGMLFGVLSGIVLVNLAVRRGWTQANKAESTSFNLDPSSLGPQPAAMTRVPREIIDPMAFQALLLAAAFAAGWGMQQGVAWLASLGEAMSFVSQLSNLPLFLFTLLGGWVVRALLQAIGAAHLIDTLSMHRLTGAAMDFLIVAALTSLRLEAVVELLWPMLLLMAVGAAWCVVNLVWLSPKLLPRTYWFELGVINFGFATATTAQGMMLLRMIDPDLRTDAAKTYAMGAPLTAPFIGGGVISFLLPKVIEDVNVSWIIAIGVVAVVALYAVGRRVAAGSPVSVVEQEA